MRKSNNPLPQPLVLLGCIVLSLTASPSLALGASATLGWEPSPGPNLEGYFLYIKREGLLVSPPPQKVSVGLALEYEADNLIPGATYSFFITAHNRFEDESEPSNLVQYTVPNERPAADPKSFTFEGTVLSFPFILSGADPEGIPLVFEIIDPPSKGEITGLGPNYVYVADTRVNDSDTFTYRVSDGFSFSETVSVEITLALNRAPAPGNDIFSREAGTQLKFSIADLLGNDTDPDNDPVSFAGVPPTTSKGGLLRHDQRWVYLILADDADANDQFTYAVNDGFGGTAMGSVTVNLIKPPRFRSITPRPGLGNDTVILTSSGIPGRTYVFEISENLTDWIPLGNSTADNKGIVTLEDTDSTHVGTRFYRMLEL